MKPYRNRKGYFTRGQVAVIYGRTKTTIRRWEKQKKLPFVIEVIDGKRVRLFPMHAVLADAAARGRLGTISPSIAQQAFQLYDEDVSPRLVAAQLQIHPEQALSLLTLWRQCQAAEAPPDGATSPTTATAARTERRHEELLPPPQSIEDWQADVAAHSDLARLELSEQKRRFDEARDRRRAERGLPPLRRPDPARVPPGQPSGVLPSASAPDDTSSGAEPPDAVAFASFLRKLRGVSSS